MKVLKASKELTKIEQYMLTVDKGAESMKDVPDGTSITVSVWCSYEDEKKMAHSPILRQSWTPAERYMLSSRQRSVNHWKRFMRCSAENRMQLLKSLARRKQGETSSTVAQTITVYSNDNK